MELKPLFARVLLEREKLKTHGSIIIPQGAQKKHAACRGKVIARGPTADESIEVGKEYIFGQYAGAWINADGRPVTGETDGDYYVCNDEDLICEVSNG